MNVLHKIYFLLTNKDKQNAILFIFFVLLTTFFEILSIGVVYPFITILLGAELPKNLSFIDDFLLFISHFFSISYLFSGLASLMLVFIIKNIFLIYYTWWKYGFSNQFQLDLAQRLFSFYISRPLIYHLENNSSIIVRNLHGEVAQIQKVFQSILELVFELTVLFAVLAMLIFIKPIEALSIMSILGTLSLIIFLISNKKITKWGEIRLNQSGKYLKNITQAFRSIKEIIITGRANLFLTLHYTQKKTLTSLLQKFALLTSIPRYLFELLAVFSLCVLVVVFLKQGKNFDQILPLIGLFIMIAYRLMPSFSRIIGSIQTINFKKPTVDNLYLELINQKQNIKSFKSFNKIEENNDDRYYLSNKIEIQNLSYSYSSSNVPSIIDLSLTINKGEMVGIIGKSGSGKSTLINLLMGLLMTEKNSIFIDKKPINEILNSWQKDIGYVPQSLNLNDESIKNNIAFGIPNHLIDENKIRKSLDFAKLNNLISSKSKGINSRVGEMGSQLSGGQLQRIAIARAVYNDPSILIFDEATSALDSVIENEIINDLKDIKENKTIILVSHKPSTLKYCDKVIEIKNGKIV
tara:strand:+ start:1099 stop:2835 length:1737 start_codon:yes stop_codon:yes gene_type:complete